jgi:methylenetetrahydrofolate reductase (NADPH)
VFPDQEIVQPTVVDRNSFLAWKDEAFELWAQWSQLYDNSSPTFELLSKMEQEWYLVNIIDNNFKSRFAIFDLLEQIAGIY